MRRALCTGTLPLAQLKAQLGRQPLEPRTPGVPTGLARQLVRFAGVGVLSTLAYMLLFLAFRSVLGAQPANLAALVGANLAATLLRFLLLRSWVFTGRAT